MIKPPSQAGEQLIITRSDAKLIWRNHHIQLFDSLLAWCEAAAAWQGAVREMTGRPGHRSWGGGGLGQAGLLRGDGWRVAPVRPGYGGWSDPLWKCSCSPADNRGQGRCQAAVVCAERWIVGCRKLRCGTLLDGSEARQDLGDGTTGHLLDWTGFLGAAAGHLRGLFWRKGRLCGLGLRVWFSTLELMTGSVEALVDSSLVGRVVATWAWAAWGVFGEDRGGTGRGRRKSGWGGITRGDWRLRLTNRRISIPILQAALLRHCVVCTVVPVGLCQTMVTIRLHKFLVSVFLNVLHLNRVCLCGPILLLCLHCRCNYPANIPHQIPLLQLSVELFYLSQNGEKKG